MELSIKAFNPFSHHHASSRVCGQKAGCDTSLLESLTSDKAEEHFVSLREELGCCC